VSKVEPSASADEAELEQLDDEALARLVRERANQPTIPISVEDLSGPDDAGGLKAREIRGEYRVGSAPVGWVRPEAVTHCSYRPIGEVVKPTRPRVKPSDMPDLPFIGMEHIEAHTMRLLGTVPASTMKSSAVHFKPGDVLYGRLRSYLNKVYRPEFEGLCSAEFIVFPKTENLDSRYLQYFLNSAEFVSFATHLNAGDRPRVDFDQLAPYPFPVAPLDQQKRIVAEIEKQFSRLDEAVANLKRVKANLKRYKAAVLKAAVEGRLVETEAQLARREGRSYETGAQLLQRILETRRSQWQGKGKYKEPAAPDTADLPELPEGWVWVSLDQLSWDSGYGTSAKCSYENEGPPVLRIPNVDKAAIELTDVKYAPSGLPVDKEEALSPGDMLVIRTNGSKPLIGRTAIVTRGFQKPTTYASYLIRFRLLGNKDLWAWVSSYWQSHSSRFWIESRAATSAGQHNISMSVLATAPIPLPPVDEQGRTVAEIDRRFSILNDSEARVDGNIKRANRLRVAILSKAFCGTSKYFDEYAEH
jgi:type I restriction enzyme, S subunit